MNRRNFMRSMGGAVAAALVGFVPPIKLSAPKKAKAVTLVCFWAETSRAYRCTDDVYREYMAKLFLEQHPYVKRLE